MLHGASPTASYDGATRWLACNEASLAPSTGTAVRRSRDSRVSVLMAAAGHSVGPAQGAGPTEWTPPSDDPFRSLEGGGESRPVTSSERAVTLSAQRVTLRCRCMSAAAMKLDKR
ncbi:hypothetical protein XOCgx_4337 [Xanthomonas oryzae pv. oryzicola]|nr:hypothetical protein XOCgx_4337 [Xanthomonas oryzae pv. oryzicola]